MTRSATPYAAMAGTGAPALGQDVSRPEAGHYRFRLRGGGVSGAVRIWHGPPCDPVTGEEMDRSWRWQASFNGAIVEFDTIWPDCTGQPIAPAEYDHLMARADWARSNAPDSSYARPFQRWDPLAPTEPMPF